MEGCGFFFLWCYYFPLPAQLAFLGGSYLSLPFFNAESDKTADKWEGKIVKSKERLAVRLRGR